MRTIIIIDYDSKTEHTEQEAAAKQHKVYLVAEEAQEKVWKVKEVWEEHQKEWAVEAATRRRVVEQVVESVVEWIQMRQVQVSFGFFIRFFVGL